jgi:hypothetical protein
MHRIKQFGHQRQPLPLAFQIMVQDVLGHSNDILRHCRRSDKLWNHPFQNPRKQPLKKSNPPAASLLRV